MVDAVHEFPFISFLVFLCHLVHKTRKIDLKCTVEDVLQCQKYSF